MNPHDYKLIARAVSCALDVASPEQTDGVYVLIHELAQALLRDNPHSFDVVEFLAACGVPND